MIKFETINELTLKVTTTGNDVIFTKTGAFIAGDCSGNTNYRFEKVLLGPQKSLAQAALGSLMWRSSLTETRSHSAMYSPTIRSLSIRML